MHYQTQQLSHQEGEAASQSPQHVKAVCWGAIGVTYGLEWQQSYCGTDSIQRPNAEKYV